MAIAAASTSICIACRETIQPGARLCPHCGSFQTRTAWHGFGASLKWIGGIVTVISLVIGVKTLHDYYQQWQQQQDAVDELTGAAEWLLRTNNYRQAWDMYLEADALSPGSPQIRRGQYAMAITWIHDFAVEKQSADAILNRLTAVLYRSLPQASDDEAATVLAHVARIQILRWHYDLPVFVDDEALLAQALRLSPSNVYANTFLAHRLLLRRPVHVESIETAQRHFRIALADPEHHAWVRDMQIGRLAMLASGNGELGRAAMQAFLSTAFEMLMAGEPPPQADLRVRVLDSYGHMGSGERVEELVGIVPPEQHLAVNAWLRKGLEYRTQEDSAYPAQQDYLVARLTEATGDRAGALALYRKLEQSEHTYRKLDPLVDAAIERLTGRKTARAQQRTYVDDPVDSQDPWPFHLDTLQHFDAKWQPDNFQQALDYFYAAVDASDGRLPAFIAAMPGILERIQAVILEGDERARMDGFTSGYSRSHYDIVRQNWTDLMLLQGAVLRQTGQLDRAIATFADARAFVEDLGDDFNRLAALSTYELALSFARRAAGSGDAADRQQALDTLRAAIDRGVIRENLVGWAEIKGEGFAALEKDPGYLELIRGR